MAIIQMAGTEGNRQTGRLKTLKAANKGPPGKQSKGILRACMVCIRESWRSTGGMEEAQVTPRKYPPNKECKN